MFLRWVCISTTWELKHWFGFGRTCAVVSENGAWQAWDKDKLSCDKGRCDYVYQALKEARLCIKSKAWV